MDCNGEKRQMKNRKHGSLRNQKGFTLVEVMVSFLILLLTSQLLMAGTAVARRIDRRANKISAVGELLEENLKDESKCLAGTLRLEIEGEADICADGWLYRYEDESDQIRNIEAVRVDESVLECMEKAFTEEKE